MLEEYIKYLGNELEESRKRELFKNLTEGIPEDDPIRTMEKIHLYSEMLPQDNDEAYAAKTYERFEKNRKIPPHPFWRNFMKYAAIVSVSVVSTWMSIGFLNEIFREEQPVSYHEVIVPAGQRTRVKLNDGTVVWIHSLSKLRYPSDFGSGNRRVELDGEAYFEVTRNEDQPFIVSVNQEYVKVLGTEFNVCAYEHNPVSVALIKGLVECSLPSSEEPVLLRPNQMVTYSDSAYSVVSFNNSDFLMWKKGIYAFDDVSFGEIVERLEHSYDVKILFEEEKLKEYRFSAKFRQQDGIETALRLMKESARFEYKRDTRKNEIIICKTKD